MVQLSRRFCYKFLVHVTVLQPRHCLNNVGLGFSHFARHYSGNHFCFLFLRLLRCFSSPGQLSDSRQNSLSSIRRVAPFGNLRIKGYLHLPEAYRSLSRPSSPLRAKASAVRPQLLSLFNSDDLIIANLCNLSQYVKELFPVVFPGLTQKSQRKCENLRS